MTDMRTRPFHVARTLYPFESRWFTRAGKAMHYVDHGRGSPVVMLHGNPTWSFLYRDVIRALDGRARVLAPDYPGFGFSDHPRNYGYTPEEHTEWIHAWLEAIDPGPCVLVMQDWGGPIGLAAALRDTRRVAGLVLINTWAWPADSRMWLFSCLMGGAPGKYLNLRHNFFADRIVRYGMQTAEHKPASVFTAYTDAFPSPASRMGTYVFPRAIRRNKAWLADIESGLRRLADRPVELVWGMRDPAFGREACIRRWLTHFPQSRVTRLDRASHYLQEDNPDAVADAVRRVLDSHDRAAGMSSPGL